MYYYVKINRDFIYYLDYLQNFGGGYDYYRCRS